MIDLQNVTGGYGNKPVVQNITLTFPDRSITALIGANGSGKSTLLRLLCGQLPPFGGEIFADGEQLSAMTRNRIAQKIAVLPQSRTVPELSVETLVLHGRFPWLSYPRVYRAQDRALAAAAMARTGILEKAQLPLPQLSGGERQRAYLAMLLAQDTQTLVFDEPTTYLDIAHQLDFFALLDELRDAGKCIVLVLHDLSAALEIADRLAVLFQGKLLQTGTPAEILQGDTIPKAFGVTLTRTEQIRPVRLI